MVAQSCSKHTRAPAQPPASTINTAFDYIHLKLHCAKRSRKAETDLEHLPCEASKQAWMSACAIHMSFRLQVLKKRPHDKTIKKTTLSTCPSYLHFSWLNFADLSYLPIYLNLSHISNCSNIKVVYLKYLSTYLPIYCLAPNYVSVNLSSFLRIYVSQTPRISKIPNGRYPIFLLHCYIWCCHRSTIYITAPPSIASLHLRINLGNLESCRALSINDLQATGLMWRCNNTTSIGPSANASTAPWAGGQITWSNVVGCWVSPTCYPTWNRFCHWLRAVWLWPQALLILDWKNTGSESCWKAESWPKKLQVGLNVEWLKRCTTKSKSLTKTVRFFSLSRPRCSYC